MDKWTIAKYKMAVNTLKVQAEQGGQVYESDILDIATDYLKANMQLKEYLNKRGHWDAVRTLADAIGYDGGGK